MNQKLLHTHLLYCRYVFRQLWLAVAPWTLHIRAGTWFALTIVWRPSALDRPPDVLPLEQWQAMEEMMDQWRRELGRPALHERGPISSPLMGKE